MVCESNTLAAGHHGSDFCHCSLHKGHAVVANVKQLLALVQNTVILALLLLLSSCSKAQQDNPQMGSEKSQPRHIEKNKGFKILIKE